MSNQICAIPNICSSFKEFIILIQSLVTGVTDVCKLFQVSRNRSSHAKEQGINIISQTVDE